MEIRESDMLFTFHDDVAAIKYDDTPFYRKSYNAIEGSKGVDIIADQGRMTQFTVSYKVESRSD